MSKVQSVLIERNTDQSKSISMFGMNPLMSMIYLLPIIIFNSLSFAEESLIQNPPRTETNTETNSVSQPKSSDSTEINNGFEGLEGIEGLEGVGGFDDLPDVELKPSSLPPPPSPIRIDGFARSQWAIWSLRPSALWAKGRQNLDLSARYKENGWLLTLEGHLEYDLLYLTEGPFDPVQKEEYQFQYIGGVQSISKQITLGGGSLTLSTGRQIVTWGELDGVSALDVVNPQDQREPGVTEIDDMRIAVWLSRLQYAHSSHILELMVRHEGSYGLLTPPRADYSPFNTLIKSQPLASMLIGDRELRLAHLNEGVSADTQSFFARYQYRGEGFDLGLYGASILDGRGVINGVQLLKDFTNAFADPQSPLTITYDHPRYYLVGMTAAKPLKSFLFKSELVSSINQPVNTGGSENLSTLAIEEVNLLTTSLSITYSGISDTTLAAEYQKSILLNDSPQLAFLFPPDIDILALRASSMFLRERLSLSGVVSMIAPSAQGPKRGGIIRFDATYRLSDPLKLSAGYVHYLTSDDFGPFYGLEEHDRLFVQLRWDFTLY